MKGLLTVFLMLGFVLTSVDAFGGQNGTTFKVQVNHEKRLKNKLKVRFVELVEDSRCPTDVNCVWAGNARIKVRVTCNGDSHDLMLDTNGPNQTAKVEGYVIKLVGLDPQPRSNIRIDRNGYVAALSVKKEGR